MERAIHITLLSYCVVVVVSGMLLPPIGIPSIDNMLLPFALLALVLLYRTNPVFWLSTGIVALVVTIYLLSNHLHGGLSKAEFLWSIRWTKLFAVGWSAFVVFGVYKKSLSTFIQVAFLGMVAVNALQLLDVGVIIHLYSPKAELEILQASTLIDSRLFGTFLNSNTNGLMFALFGTFFLLSEIQRKYLYAFLAIVLLIMTQSRTAFLAFALVVAALALIKITRNNKRLMVLFVAGGTIALIALSQLKLQNLNSLFDGSAYSSNSVTTRVEVIKNTLELNASSKWLGQGKITNIPEIIGASIDNEYAYIYLEYGILGMLSFGLIVIFLLRVAWTSQARELAISLVAIMLLCGLTNLSFSNMELGPLFFVLFGAALVLTRKKQIDQQTAAH